MEKKYRLLKNDTIVVDNIVDIKTLYRIEALKDFSDVKKGDKGGYVESEANLSHYGDCWIYDNACVYDRVIVVGNSIVSGYARLRGNNLVCGNTKVYDLFGYTIMIS